MGQIPSRNDPGEFVIRPQNHRQIDIALDNLGGGFLNRCIKFDTGHRRHDVFGGADFFALGQAPQTDVLRRLRGEHVRIGREQGDQFDHVGANHVLAPRLACSLALSRQRLECLGVLVQPFVHRLAIAEDVLGQLQMTRGGDEVILRGKNDAAGIHQIVVGNENALFQIHPLFHACPLGAAIRVRRVSIGGFDDHLPSPHAVDGHARLFGRIDVEVVEHCRCRHQAKGIFAQQVIGIRGEFGASVSALLCQGVLKMRPGDQAVLLPSLIQLADRQTGWIV